MGRTTGQMTGHCGQPITWSKRQQADEQDNSGLLPGKRQWPDSRPILLDRFHTSFIKNVHLILCI